MTYDQAKQIAKKYDPKINAVSEYPDAYIFTNTKAIGDEMWDNEVVILKQNGEIISYSEWVMNSKYADKEVQVKLI